jgi:gamma-aminobutyric acid type B receptor
VWVCSDASSPGYFWQIFIYTYLVMLQIVGIVLAFQTRKVKLPGLRDSKFIASIVYISSIILVILALVTFGLRTYINIGTGIFVAGIITLTTITLGLIFIPKVCTLHVEWKTRLCP